MYPISERFKHYLKDHGREFEGKVVINGLSPEEIADGIVDESVEVSGSSVVDFDMEDSGITGEEFMLGAVVSSKLNMSLRTTESIPDNAKIQPFIRMLNPLGDTEWLPLGVFFVDSRVKKGGVIQLTCFDKLITAQRLYDSGLLYPVDMQTVLEEIALLLGLHIAPGLVLDKSYVVTENPKGYTYRDVLGFISTAYSSSVRINREGYLDFIDYTDKTVRETITSKDYINLHITNPVKKLTRITANYDSDIEETEVGDGELDNTLFIYNPYATEPMLEDILESAILDLEYTPIDMTWRGRPDLDVGDWVTVKDTDGTTFNTMLLQNKFSYKGGLHQTTKSPSFSAQQTEFGFDGGVSGVIGQIEKRLGVYIELTNGSFLRIKQKSQAKMVLPLTAMGQTSIEFTIVLIGTSSHDSVLNLQMVGETPIGPVFKCFVKEGWNTVNVSFLAKDILAMSDNIRLMMSIEEGEFFVDRQQGQFFAYGANLLGSSGVPYASVEDEIDISHLISGLITTDTMFTGLQKPKEVFAPVDTIDIADMEPVPTDSVEVLIEIWVYP